MRLLDRYLLRELLIPLGYCLGGFLIFWISFDLFSELEEFQENGLGAVDIARYYLVKTPELLVVVMPIALLLALLYALTHHARYNELVAIRAAGISLWRLSAAYLIIGCVFSLALFALNELWVPRTAELTQAMLRYEQKGVLIDEQGRWFSNLNFRNARDGRIWNIGGFNLDTYEMRNPQIAWKLEDESRRSLLAQRAVRSNDAWVFFEVQEIIYPPMGKVDPATGKTNQFDPIMTNAPVLVVPEFSETPEQIKSEIKISRLSSIEASKEPQLSLSDIANYLRLHPELSARDYALLHTQYHARLAWPWTCLVVVLIALPFGALSGRRNVFVGVASSIFICFAFFILLRFGLTLGTGARLPPVVAAWLPNALFAAGGIALTARVR